MGNPLALLRALAWLCLVAAWLGPAPAGALDPRRSLTQYRQDVWQGEDGLPHSSIFALAQTREGYLWLGTWDGLARFDGARFTVYDRRNTPELRGPAVLALVEDTSGVLWVGTEKGLVAYEGGRFRRVEPPDGQGPLNVRALALGEGSLWVGTTQGLVRVPLSGRGPWRRYTQREGLPGRAVVSLAQDREGTLWVGTALGLARLSGERLVPVALPGGGTPRVGALREASDGTLWVGTASGLYALQGGRATRHGRREGLPHEHVTSLWEDRHGNLWVGTERGGLARGGGGGFSALGPQAQLGQVHVTSLLEDRQGQLWLGTSSNGLVRLRDGAFLTLGVPEGLRSDLALAVLEDSTGALWVGTQGGGLHRLKDGQLTRLGAAEGLPTDTVRSLAEAPDGALWVGTFSGAFRHDGQRFTPLGREQGLPHDTVWSLLADSRGEVWLGTGAGLARLGSGGTLTVYGEDQGVPAAPITALAEDEQGVLWFGTHAGLVRLEDNTFTRYTTREGLTSDVVLSLYAEPRGGLWVGTQGGLSWLREGQVRRLTSEQGLHDDTVFSLLPEGEGHLWMSGPRGVWRVALDELRAVAEGRRALLRPTAFDQRDGMRSAECTGGAQPAGWRGRDGRLWFTTVRGVVSVDPRQVRPSLEPPEVRLEEVRVQGLPLAHAGGPLVLAPGSRDVEVRYTAFSRGDNTRLRFRHRLEGHDDVWVEAEGRREVTYSQLAPGTYRLEVTASERGGPWAEPTSLELRQQPWFYQTVWFYTLWVAGAGALGVALYRLRVGRLEARERWLRQRVEERTGELARANQELEAHMRALRQTQAQLVQAGKMAAVGTLAAGVGHEINNPLAYIISNLEFASAGVAALARQPAQPQGPLASRLREMEQALHEALQGADRVRRIVMDLKTFSRGDEERRGPVDLHAVLDSAAKMVAGELRPRGRLLRDYEGSAWVEGNEARLAQVFLNLLINAAQALPEGRPELHQVRLSTRREGERVVAEVRDTGCGIPPEVLGRIFDPFFTTKPVGVGTGLGLALCHAFITGMGGEIGVESEPGRGTLFRVALPASRAEPASPPAPAPPAPQPLTPVPRGPLRGRVLLVDDDPLVSSAMRRTLARAHDVEALASARQALEVLVADPRGYDVVLCDLMMPDMTGMELHAQLQARAPALAERMVFVTGGAFTPAAQAFLERVPNPRLEKPFEPERLRELVLARVELARAAPAA